MRHHSSARQAEIDREVARRIQAARDNAEMRQAERLIQQDLGGEVLRRE